MNIMYTIYPLSQATFDTFGFILISIVICLILLLFFCVCLEESNISMNDLTFFASVSGIVLLIFSVVFYSFYNDFKEKPIPKNEIVCGNRLGFDSDMTSGKKKNLAGYVQYDMCDGSGIVTLQVDEKRSYPVKLNFYKN